MVAFPLKRVWREPQPSSKWKIIRIFLLFALCDLRIFRKWVTLQVYWQTGWWVASRWPANSLQHTLNYAKQTLPLHQNVSHPDRRHTRLIFQPSSQYSLELGQSTPRTSLTHNNPVVEQSGGGEATLTVTRRLYIIDRYYRQTISVRWFSSN